MKSIFLTESISHSHIIFGSLYHCIKLPQEVELQTYMKWSTTESSLFLYNKLADSNSSSYTFDSFSVLFTIKKHPDRDDAREIILLEGIIYFLEHSLRQRHRIDESDVCSFIHCRITRQGEKYGKAVNIFGISIKKLQGKYEMSRNIRLGNIRREKANKKYLSEKYRIGDYTVCVLAWFTGVDFSKRMNDFQLGF